MDIDTAKKHFLLMKEFSETNERLIIKHIKFANIVEHEFDSGFGKYLFDRIPIEKVKDADNDMDRIESIKSEMSKLADSVEDNLKDIEERANIFLNIAKNLELFFDSVFDYYEEYNNIE